MYASAAELVEQVQTILDGYEFVDSTTQLTTYRLLDRVDLREHFGFLVECPHTRDTEQASDPQLLEDDVVVRLSISTLRVAGQNELVRRALDHDRSIRQIVDGAAVLQPFSPTYVDTDRAYTPGRDFLDQTIRFKFSRLEPRAGG